MKAVQFNPHTSHQHLLAVGRSDGTLNVLDLTDPQKPKAANPNKAGAVPAVDPINCVAWNSQVPRIMASATSRGTCVVWDFAANKPWCQVRCAAAARTAAAARSLVPPARRRTRSCATPTGLRSRTWRGAPRMGCTSSRVCHRHARRRCCCRHSRCACMHACTRARYLNSCARTARRRSLRGRLPARDAAVGPARIHDDAPRGVPGPHEGRALRRVVPA